MSLPILRRRGERHAILGQLAILIVLPIAPLTLTLMPVDKMIDGLIKLLL